MLPGAEAAPLSHTTKHLCFLCLLMACRTGLAYKGQAGPGSREYLHTFLAVVNVSARPYFFCQPFHALHSGHQYKLY